jgi:anion-transporting  ArsA/GET3 family ATPase
MASLLQRGLIVVTGKGGTGKTTVTCALGLLAARRGLRTILVEVGERHRLAELFGVDPGEEVALRDGLWSSTIDPDRATSEWLAALAGRVSARMLTASSSFQYLAAAAPGARELVTMREVLELRERSARRSALRDGEARRYDLVVLDAPATGHALAMLRSPRTFSAIARVGPLAEQARKVQEVLEDSGCCAYLAVTHASEMAISETLELDEGLHDALDRHLDAVIVNGVLPARFTRTELKQLERLPAGSQTLRAAVCAARTTYLRSQAQQGQIRRLRRARSSLREGAPRVTTIPFQFVAGLDVATIERIAMRLARSVDPEPVQ